MDNNAQSNARDILETTVETLDIQRQLTASRLEENAAIQRMIGFTRTLKVGILERFAKERELAKEIKNIEKELQAQRKVTETQKDEALREQSKLAEEGMAQRLTAYSKELEMLQKINSAAIAPILYFLGKTYELFLSLDKAAWEFRKAMGFTRDAAADIRAMSEKMAIDFMHIGVSIGDVYGSVVALTKEMGSAHAISTELVKTTAVLKAQLGISEDITAQFLRNMATIAGSSMEAQQQMAYMAGSLSNAAGVPLGAVMKDVASRSNTTLTMMSRIPSIVIRSAVELRKMGTELDRVAKSSREILNFTDNVNAEMEASVLLGQSINLQRARELAYRRDLEGSTKEILRLTKSISFESLDVFQQEAFARATGKSVDELMSLVQAEKQWDAARKSSDPAMRARVAAYEQLRSANAATQKDSARQLETMLMQKNNQERITAITLKWQQILAKAGEVLLPVIDKLLEWTPAIMDIALAFVNVGSVIWTIGKGLQEGGLLLATWFEKIGVVSSAFFKIAGFGEKILSVFGMVVSPFLKIGALIGTWAPFVLKFVSPFLKILGPIGWIITAFQAISGFMRGMQNGGGFLGGLKGAFVAVIPFGDKILQFLSFMWEKIGPIGRFIFKWLTPLGLMIQGVKYLANLFKNIGPGILEGLLAPFKAAWDWIKGIFVGKSPSNLGLGIVKGIMSVQAMLFDAITYPWRHALAWIADKIPGMGKVADKLRGGFGGLTNSVEAKAAESPTVASQITPKPTTLANTPQTVAAKTGADAAVAQDSSTKVLDDILMAIKTLNSNLESGKIGFYVDGQLLSATIARQTEFRGGYGVNKL